jgi:hypothetical protein
MNAPFGVPTSSWTWDMRDLRVTLGDGLRDRP